MRPTRGAGRRGGTSGPPSPRRMRGGRVVEPGKGHDQAPEGSQDGQYDERVREPSTRGPEGGEGHGAGHGGGPLAHRLERHDAQERVVDDQVEDGDPQDAQPEGGGEMPPRVLDLPRHVGHVDPAVVGEEDGGHAKPHQPDEAGESGVLGRRGRTCSRRAGGAAKSRLPTTRDSRPTILTVVRTTCVRPPHLTPCRFTIMKSRMAAAPQPAAESEAWRPRKSTTNSPNTIATPPPSRGRSPTSPPRS